MRNVVVLRNVLALRNTIESRSQLLMLWGLYLQGCAPTVARAMVLNATQLASYSEAKQAIKRRSTPVPILPSCLLAFLLVCTRL